MKQISCIDPLGSGLESAMRSSSTGIYFLCIDPDREFPVNYGLFAIELELGRSQPRQILDDPYSMEVEFRLHHCIKSGTPPYSRRGSLHTAPYPPDNLRQLHQTCSQFTYIYLVLYDL